MVQGKLGLSLFNYICNVKCLTVNSVSIFRDHIILNVLLQVNKIIVLAVSQAVCHFEENVVRMLLVFQSYAFFRFLFKHETYMLDNRY